MLIAIAKLLIASGPAFVVFVLLFVFLGGDAKAVWVILLVFFGTVTAELVGISGSICAKNSGLAWWPMIWCMSKKYKHEFLKKLPRYGLRLLSWALLTFAGMILVERVGF